MTPTSRKAGSDCACVSVYSPVSGEVVEVRVFDKAFEDALRTVREQVLKQGVGGRAGVSGQGQLT